MSKLCLCCFVEKDFSEFYKMKQAKDGYHNKCKECTKKGLKIRTIALKQEFKLCSKCKNTYKRTNENFYKSIKNPDGLSRYCIKCDKEVKNKYKQENKDKVIESYKKTYRNTLETRKEYQEKNKEELKEYHKNYAQKNKEELKSKSQIYREKNKEKIAARRRKYYLENKEHIIDRVKIYYRNNKESVQKYKRLYLIKNNDKQKAKNKKFRILFPERYRAYANNYTLRKKNAMGNFSNNDIKNKLIKQNNKCYWCNCKLDNKYQIDHIVPLSKGGTNYLENIAITCISCNASKSDKMPDEWERYLKNVVIR